MNSTHTIRGLFIGFFLVATIAAGQFVEPSGSPSTMNATEPLTLGTARQQKSGDLIADFLTARNKWCLGASCITSLWSSLAPSTCRLESKTVNVGWDVDLAYNTCDALLTKPAKNLGWVSSGGDNCTGMSSGNCASGRTCVFMRLYCTGGGVAVLNSSNAYQPVSTVVTQPATAASIFSASGGTINLPYNLTRDPQCNDGIDNPGSGAGTDMTDPQCKHPGDDSETIL